MIFAFSITGITILILLLFNACSLFKDRELRKLSELANPSGLSGEIENQTVIKGFIPDEAPPKLSPVMALIKEIDDKLVLAGMIEPWQKWCFGLVQAVLSLVAFTFATTIIYSKMQNEAGAFVGGFCALILGFKLPLTIVERNISGHQELIRDQFPVIIDDILISVDGGVTVSSAVTALVALSKENGDANPAIQILDSVLNYVKGGMTLGDAFIEAARQTKLTEVRHAMRLLANCEQHGGDIKGQLTALADGLLFQKQINIEEKLVSLPVKASVPLALVFGGFFAFLFSSLFSTIANSGFQSSF